MSATIYFYTGSGNSLWVARQLSSTLAGGADLQSMISPANEEQVQPTTPVVGLVFPVHIWGVPYAVIDFIQRINGMPGQYFFAVAVNAGQVASTLLQLRQILARRQIALSTGFSVSMPSNYIPWGGPGPQEKIEARLNAAKVRLDEIAVIINKREQKAVEKGPLWQRILFSALYHMSYEQVPKMDGKFWTDDRCNGCGICEKICPARNITIDNGKPAWHHRCQQCFACLQFCPKTALQYGQKTPKYERYHHPEVRANDLINLISK